MFTKCAMKILTDNLDSVSCINPSTGVAYPPEYSYVLMTPTLADYDANPEIYYTRSGSGTTQDPYTFTQCQPGNYDSGTRYFMKGYYLENLIPGYSTLGVSGRENIEVELNTETIGRNDGERSNYRRFKARELTISFAITNSAYINNSNYRHYLLIWAEKLNQFINLKDAQFIFDDEPDKFFKGTVSGKAEFSISMGILSGSFTIYCVDPFKYSTNLVEITGALPQSYTTPFKVVSIPNVVSGYKCYPEFFVDFYTSGSATPTTNGDCGFVNIRDNEFSDNANSIQFGKINEEDVSDILYNTNFKAGASVSGWSTYSNASFEKPLPGGQTFNFSGSIGINENGMVISEAGAPSKGAFHGPIGHLSNNFNLAQSTSNFNFEWVHQIVAASKSEYGALHVFISSGNKILAGMCIFKNKSGTKASVVHYALKSDNDTINSSTKSSNSFKIDKKATFNKDAEVLCSIKRDDSTITITTGPYTTEFKESSVLKTNMNINYGFFKFSNSKTGNKLKDYSYLDTNRIINCKFYYGENVDIKNSFTTNDRLYIDCRTMNVELNGAPNYSLGDIGNDWDDMYLTPGKENKYFLTWSDWLENSTYFPNIKVRYRGRYI